MDKLLKISADVDNCYWGTKEWRVESNRTFICSYCNGVLKDWYPKPINFVFEEYPDDRLTGSIWSKCVSIFRSDFIELIQGYLRGHVLGQCFLPDGAVIDKFVTCYTNDLLLLRGGKKDTRFFECPECGRFNSSRHCADEYTLRCYLKDDVRVYQDFHSNLYIDEDLAMEIDFTPWPDVKLKPIPILGAPLDMKKLPCDPPDAPWDRKLLG